jgi:hypothetical protein
MAQKKWNRFKKVFYGIGDGGGVGVGGGGKSDSKDFLPQSIKDDFVQQSSPVAYSQLKILNC